ncbi:MAG: DUF1211 domain-containing protein [Parvularculaceae bacterium]|nr:DUF1211 domain-containing protein [Parvularculaceae bacterium]
MRPASRIYTDQDPHFRWRGAQVMRVEYLSDIVFALAFGMLVSNGVEPRTFEELNGFLFSAIPVTAGFIIMVSFWTQHFLFFRRYGLADKRTMFINACILLVVLIIAYPLRFIFDSLFGWVLLMFGNDALVDQLNIDFRRAGIIIAYFMTGLAVLQILLAALYRHALVHADALDLTTYELQVTRAAFWEHASFVFWAGLAAILAVTTPLYGFAGFLTLFGRLSDRIIRKSIIKADPENHAADEASDPSSPPRQTPVAPSVLAPESSKVLRRDR